MQRVRRALQQSRVGQLRVLGEVQVQLHAAQGRRSGAAQMPLHQIELGAGRQLDVNIKVVATG